MKPVMPAGAAKPAGAGKLWASGGQSWRGGCGVLGYGLLGLPTQLGPPQLLGLLVWMAVAVLLHDGVIVPASTLAGAGLTRVGSGSAQRRARCCEAG